MQHDSTEDCNNPDWTLSQILGLSKFIKSPTDPRTNTPHATCLGFKKSIDTMV